MLTERSSVMGKLLLVISFVTMLSGRFSFARLSADLPDFDLRWLLVLSGFLLAGFWVAVERPPRPPQPMPGGFTWFALWTLWMILALVWAPTTHYLGAELENLFLLGLSVMLAAFVMRRTSHQGLDIIWWLLLVAAALYLVDALLRGPSVAGRYSAFGGGPNVFVRIMVLGTLSALALSSMKGRAWPLLLAPLFAFGAVLSGSRGGVVSAALILVASAVPLLRGLGTKRRLFLAVLSALLIVFSPRALGQARVSEMYERFILGPLVEGNLGSRDVLADRAFSLFQAHPLIGAGTGSVAAESISGERGLHAHNLLLATMAEGGGIGLALLVVSLITFVIAIVRNRPLPTTPRFSLIAAVYIFGAALFSGDYYDSRFMWFFLLIAFTSATRARTFHESPSDSTPRERRAT